MRRERSVDLPPEAEAIRDEVRAFADEHRGPRRRRAARRAHRVRLRRCRTGPQPWGRDAGAVEQLVIEQEFAAAGISRPAYGITGWVILTLIQHATDDQVARWVRPALTQEVIWCQLFSEPDAGSDAAGIKTRGTRVDGGWLVNGQKVWTSGAHVAGMGFATVRTDPDAPKHDGITTMVIDMHAEGVEVRPLKMPTGGSEFNEVFFNDVFVPDDDVVGPVDGGWTVARATLGNESVSIGGGQGGMALPGDALIAAVRRPPRAPRRRRRPRSAATSPTHQAMARAQPAQRPPGRRRRRPGPGGQRHQAGAVRERPRGGGDPGRADRPRRAPSSTGPAPCPACSCSCTGRMSIAGGTSEIKRNQIGERILGLPATR